MNNKGNRTTDPYAAESAAFDEYLSLLFASWEYDPETLTARERWRESYHAIYGEYPPEGA